MTAAHRPGAILTPRYRGARAVASFNAADARSRADRDADNRISARPPSRDITHCPGRSSARPAPLFNGRNAGVDRIGERGAVGDGAHAVGALICARPHAKTARRTKREIDTRPSTISNAASNERSPEPGRCLVSSEAPGCRGDAYTQPSPCEMTTHCMAKANAGEGGRHGCTHSDRQRPARFAAGLCRLPRPFSSL